MLYRYFSIILCCLALLACGGGSSNDDADGGSEKATMTGYKLPDSIDILETVE